MEYYTPHEISPLEQKGGASLDPKYAPPRPLGYGSSKKRAKNIGYRQTYADQGAHNLGPIRSLLYQANLCEAV